MKIVLAVCLALGAPTVASAQTAEALQVTFVVNDAYVKDRALAGVTVTVTPAIDQEAVYSGVTDPDGRLVTMLPAATYRVSYALPGYVPIGGSETRVHSDGQIITTAMSMLLEAEGTGAAQRVRIILNWGSDPAQVRDADSHLLCACGQSNAHVYYVDKNHARGEHTVDLDVDDTDWGGPETITIADPLPGDYLYWVHDYSGPPAVLGESDVVVRVLFDDVEAGEFHTPGAVVSRSWRPFKALVIESDLRPRIVRFTDEEIESAADLELPPGAVTFTEEDDGGDGCVWFLVTALLGLMAVVAIIAVLVAWGRRR